MYLPKVLLDEIDKGCAKTGLNRTDYIVHVMLNHFDQQRTLDMASLVEQLREQRGFKL